VARILGSWSAWEIALAAAACGVVEAAFLTAPVQGRARRVALVVVDSDTGRGYVRACQGRQREWSVLAGVAALVSLGAGSVAQFSQGDREPPDTSARGRKPRLAGRQACPVLGIEVLLRTDLAVLSLSQFASALVDSLRPAAGHFGTASHWAGSQRGTWPEEMEQRAHRQMR
jgi:hypothetical protein